MLPRLPPSINHKTFINLCIKVLYFVAFEIPQKNNLNVRLILPQTKIERKTSF